VGSAGTLVDQLQHLTADLSTVSDPLPAIDEEAARFSPGVSLCERQGVLRRRVPLARAGNPPRCAVPRAGQGRVHALSAARAADQPLLVAAARVVASRALGRPSLPDDLGELVRAPYWEAAAGV